MRSDDGDSMISLKQLEALYWIGTLGTFQKAASRLNTSQSAISKRIIELETALGYPVFDRTLRKVKLTRAGESVLDIGKQMLQLEANIRDLENSETIKVRSLRIGITQLSATTWLPRFINYCSEQYGEVDVLVHVDIARNLYEAVLDETLDLAILPDFYSDESIRRYPTVQLEGTWLASPKFLGLGGSISRGELARNTFLSQTLKSAAGSQYSRWLRSEGIEFNRTIYCDNLVALSGMAVAQLGVAILPRHNFRHLLDDGRLVELETGLVIPKIQYAVICKADRETEFLSEVVSKVIDFCDFEGSLIDVGK